MTEIADVSEVLIRPVAMAVVPRGRRWAARKIGATRAARLFANQRDAINYALKAPAVVYVFGSNGRIEKRIANV